MTQEIILGIILLILTIIGFSLVYYYSKKL